jgi:hypothetical protein
MLPGWSISSRILSARANAEEMRQVTVGIKATAVHALLTAANVAGMSERLTTAAAVIEAVIPPDSEPPTSAVNHR